MQLALTQVKWSKTNKTGQRVQKGFLTQHPLSLSSFPPECLPVFIWSKHIHCLSLSHVKSSMAFFPSNWWTQWPAANLCCHGDGCRVKVCLREEVLSEAWLIAPITPSYFPSILSRTSTYNQHSSFHWNTILSRILWD